MTRAFWLAAITLWERELIRFWRQKSRVLGFVGMPLLFWLFIGSGFGDLAFFFPGALTMTVMFSAIFSMMSLIEDRREGFLLSVLVSPAPRAAIATGKILGAATLAWLQGVIFLLFLPLTTLRPSPLALAQLVAVLYVIAFTFTALGFVFAWQMDSTQGFHAVMNLVLFPLWMVSGALFTVNSAHGWMQWLMKVNPLTYALAALRRLLEPAPPAGTPEFLFSLVLTALSGVLLWIASAVAAGRRPARSFS